MFTPTKPRLSIKLSLLPALRPPLKPVLPSYKIFSISLVPSHPDSYDFRGLLPQDLYLSTLEAISSYTPHMVFIMMKKKWFTTYLLLTNPAAMLPIDPLSPNINMHLLHTVLRMVPLEKFFFCNATTLISSLDYHFINSHDLSVWSGCVIVGRNWLWVTIGT